MTIILAIESSCDDTAAAIVNDKGLILAEALYSQRDLHSLYGGVVPEVGSRAHIEQILSVVKSAFFKAKISPTQIDAVAATFAPGLIGPLLVGTKFAQGVALALNKPLIAVHHIEGHLMAGFLEKDFPDPPFIGLVVSGGHTALYLCTKEYEFQTLGETLDDAAGEAFDKVGRVLGLKYPAGQAIDNLAKEGVLGQFPLTMPMASQGGLNFSFSGLKTQCLRILQERMPLDQTALRNFCADFREIVAKTLVKKAIAASKLNNNLPLVLGGGVALNSRLRELLVAECQNEGIYCYLSNKSQCMDNAVMIAKAAHKKYALKKFAPICQEVFARLSIEDKHQLDY